jgi:ArsR family transcriptional regulator
MTLDATLALLQAAADPSRLRLLAALAQGEATVAELVQALEQSQPRISRHLRLLDEAGLVEHFRESRWVYYRLARGQPALDLATLIQQLADSDDAQIRGDAGRLAALRQQREREALRGRLRLAALPAAGASPLAEADLAAGLDAVLGDGPLGRVLDIGAGTGTVLRLLGQRVEEGTGVDSSRQMRLLARARLQAAGLPQCSLRDADAHELPFPDRHFDLVIVDGVLQRSPRPAVLLAEAARVLADHGRLLVLDRILPAVHEPGPPTPGTLNEHDLHAWLRRAGLAPARRHWLPGRAPDQALITALRVQPLSPTATPTRTGTDD